VIQAVKSTYWVGSLNRWAPVPATVPRARNKSECDPSAFTAGLFPGAGRGEGAILLKLYT
jgi:hypothetical protein